MEANRVQEDIEKALQGLTPRERMVFVLRHYQDLALKEIAEAMDVSEGTVKSFLFRAIKKLQKSLAVYVEPAGRKEFTMNTCEKMQDLFVEALYNDLKAEQQSSLDAHLAECVRLPG